MVSARLPVPNIFQEEDFSAFNKCFKNVFKGKEKLKILVSISGGSDSVLLLYLMLRFNSGEKDNIKIAHVNHNLRDNSIEDQNFVLKLGKHLKVNTLIRQLNPKKRAKKESIESWARQERYRVLNELAVQTCSDIIVTGHHKNDQVETILKNLSEQAGLFGLGGMKIEYKNIIRPLLSFSKNQLNKMIDKYGIPHIEDSSNNNLNLKRNFIRKEILKPWANNDNEVIESIAMAGSYFQEYQNALLFFINDFISKYISQIKKDCSLINKNDFNKIPLIARVLVLQVMTTSLGRLRKHDFENIKTFINNKKVGHIYKSRFGWVLLNDRTKFLLKMNDADKKNEYIYISLGNKINFNEYEYILKTCNRRKKFSRDPNIELIDLDKIKNKKLHLRFWRKGDSFKPLGMLGNQKVSDYLINKKVNQFEKMEQVVLVAEEKIIWLCGHRIDDSMKISSSSENIIEIRRTVRSNYL